jgi:hypothetical protein
MKTSSSIEDSSEYAVCRRRGSSSAWFQRARTIEPYEPWLPPASTANGHSTHSGAPSTAAVTSPPSPITDTTSAGSRTVR